MDHEIKDKVINLFNNYFDNIESEYDMKNEDINNLRKKVKDNVNKIINKEIDYSKFEKTNQNIF